MSTAVSPSPSPSPAVKLSVDEQEVLRRWQEVKNLLKSIAVRASVPKPWHTQKTLPEGTLPKESDLPEVAPDSWLVSLPEGWRASWKSAWAYARDLHLRGVAPGKIRLLLKNDGHSGIVDYLEGGFGEDVNLRIVRLLGACRYENGQDVVVIRDNNSEGLALQGACRMVYHTLGAAALSALLPGCLALAKDYDGHIIPAFDGVAVQDWVSANKVRYQGKSLYVRSEGTGKRKAIYF